MSTPVTHKMKAVANKNQGETNRASVAVVKPPTIQVRVRIDKRV